MEGTMKNTSQSTAAAIPDANGSGLDQHHTAPALVSIDKIEVPDAESLAEVGVLLEEGKRSATYFMRDFHPVCSQSETEGLEMIPIAVALEKYAWVREKYYFKAVPADKNEITARSAALEHPEGFFLHVKAGAKVELPCQAALYISQKNIEQLVHNIIVLEEGSELTLITGCATHQEVLGGVHHAISEQYIGKDATLINTMIHSWGPEVVVRPNSGTIVEQNGNYVNNYISLRPAGDILSNPQTWLVGENASAKYLTVILGSEDSLIQTGGDVYLNADGTRAELAHRGVSTGGQVYQSGLLVGNANCRAHVDCAGMLLDPGENGFIESTPGIRAMHPGAELSHEASIGKIAPEEVEYLQSRGMDERTAISMIIRGFLDADIEGLGPELDARIAEIAELAGHGEA